MEIKLKQEGSDYVKKTLYLWQIWKRQLTKSWLQKSNFT